MNMFCTPTDGPERRRLVAKIAIVLAIPGCLLATWASVLRAKGPYWLGTNLDPDYPYLLNGLNILHGYAPGHVDHPGTPVQILVGIIIKVTHVLSGSGPLAEDVIRRPEHYLAAANWVMLFLLAATIAAAGVAAVQSTGSLLAGMAIELIPGLSPVIALNVVCVKPEPLLALLAIALALLVLRTLGSQRVPRPFRQAAGFGIVIGLAVATKITAAPLAVLPFVMLEGLAAQGIFIASAFSTAALVTLPSWRALPVLRNFVGRIFTHSGLYGVGPPSMFNATEYRGALASLAVGIGPTPIVIGISGLAAGAFVWSRAEGGDANARLGRALLGTVAAQVAALLVVARQPAVHYLLPALALSGLVGALVAHALFTCLRTRSKRISAAATLLVGAALAFIVEKDGRAIADLRSRLRSQSEEQFAVVLRQGRDFGGALVTRYYRSSAPAYGLHFGNQFAGARWSALLDRLYPGSVFYNPWSDRLEFYLRPKAGRGAEPSLVRAPFNLENLCRLGAGARTILFEGTPFASIPSMIPGRPSFRDKLRLVYSSSAEALYEAPPCP